MLRIPAIPITSRILIAAFVWLFTVTPSFAADPLSSAVAVLEKEARQKSRAFSTRDFGRDEFNGPHSVLVHDDRAEALLWKIRSQMLPGVVAFCTRGTSLAKTFRVTAPVGFSSHEF